MTEQRGTGEIDRWRDREREAPRDRERECVYVYVCGRERQRERERIKKDKHREREMVDYRKLMIGKIDMLVKEMSLIKFTVTDTEQI